MNKQFFDYGDGDFARAISDTMAMDLETGETHMISGWHNEEDDD